MPKSTIRPINARNVFVTWIIQVVLKQIDRTYRIGDAIAEKKEQHLPSRGKIRSIKCPAKTHTPHRKSSPAHIRSHPLTAPRQMREVLMIIESGVRERLILIDVPPCYFKQRKQRSAHSGRWVSDSPSGRGWWLLFRGSGAKCVILMQTNLSVSSIWTLRRHISTKE